MSETVVFKGKIDGVAHRASLLLQREREVVPQEFDPCLRQIRTEPALSRSAVSWPEPFIPEGDDGA